MSAVHLITPTRVVVLWLGELAHDREVPGSIPPNFFEDSILFLKVFSVSDLVRREGRNIVTTWKPLQISVSPTERLDMIT